MKREEEIKSLWKMSKGFDIPHNKHLGNPNDYWGAPQKNSHKIDLNPPQEVELKLVKEE